jgi:alkylation response protein AidB-like acyl-CoA dehydrogenase
MEFLLSAEQIEIQDTVTRFLEKTCPSTELHKAFNNSTEFPTSVWQGLIDMGILAITVPEKFGGLEMDLLDLAIVAEKLGYAGAPGPLLGHTLCTQALVLAGSEEQKSKWLPRLANGECLGSFANAEHGSQWLDTTLTLSNGKLNGEKRHVLYGEHADIIVVALANNEFAIIEKGANGLIVIPENVTDRSRTLDTLTFTGCEAETLKKQSRTISETLLNICCVLLAADSFGGAYRCIDMATDYAKTRNQFGNVIGKFQAIKHQLANMAVDVEPMRGLYWHAAYSIDHDVGIASRQASLAKSHLSDRFLHVARENVLVHGGIGYTWECDAQIFLKRALFNFAYMGSASLHKKRAARLATW